MIKVTLSFLAGLAITVVAAVAFWFVMPFIFVALSIDSQRWLTALPAVALIPSLILGGFSVARLVPLRRFVLAPLVGGMACALFLLVASVSGELWFLLLLVPIAALISGIGAVFVSGRSIEE